MTYRELFQFEAVAPAVRLRDADTKEGAARLVAGYVISEEMAARLTGSVFPHLQFNQPGEAKAILVVGGHGTGKSHWLSVVSSLAEHGALADGAGSLEALKLDPATQDERSAGLDAVAGRFKVIRVEVSKIAKSLQTAILARIEEYLAAQGVPYSFPKSTPASSVEPAFAQMMGAFHERFPKHGLLVVVDELVDYLRMRNDQQLISDLNLLAQLGAVCQHSKFRFLAGLREPILDHVGATAVEVILRQIKDRYAQVSLGAEDLRFVVSERLVRKTPAQRTQIEEYLTKFAPAYAGMTERLGEFVATFPVHPDYLQICDKVALVQRRDLLRTLSDATKKRLDETVPEDRLELIAYDSYWEKLRGDPALQQVPEIEAVITFSRGLESALQKSFPLPESKAMARRLLWALSVHRLTTDDIYSQAGTTPTELRDQLCLFQPGLEKMEGAPADHLLAQISSVLQAVHQSVGRHRVSSNPDTQQHYLHLKKFKRFVTPELILHWVNAVPFVMLILTGGIMMASRFWHLDHKVFARVVLTHKVFATVWMVGLPLVLSLSPKVHWNHLRLMLKWGVGDLLWIVQSSRSLLNKNAVVPPAGRFNTGQKINACLVMVYFLGYASTGLSMHFKGSTLFPWYVHAALFFASLNTVGGHLFLSLVNRSTRVSLPGIFHGWSPMEYIEHHHPLSLPPARQSHVHPVSVKKTLGEILASKLELALLLVSVLMAAAGAWAFQKGLLSSAKIHFSKSFSALISPSQLSTKHRMGASSERCTQCHTYTGGIPDANCERCHLIVKEYRAKTLGYHGTLKGDCIQCHKEHPTGTNAVIPLVRENFKHDLTGLKLEGKHAKLDCDECHKKKRTPQTPGIYYIGLKHDTCADCHADPHDRQFTAACVKCHAPAGWTGKELKFSHAADSSYKLAGKHSAVDCLKCHKPASPQAHLATAVFKGLSRGCEACHQDPHRQQFTVACATCHTPETWKKEKLLFDHDRDSKFPLTGKHAGRACVKCHRPTAPGGSLASAQFHDLPAECADCHRDPHRSQFDQPCAKCHTPASWKRRQLSFDHNKDAKYPLLAKHADVACEKCHIPTDPRKRLAWAQFRDLPSDCADCHKDPHSGQFERACAKCHLAPVSWSQKHLQFEHARDTKFALVGKHTAVPCIKCHLPRPTGGPLASALFKGLGTSCETCHKVKHPASYGPLCVSCHNTDRWPKQNPGMDHIVKSQANGEHLAGKHLTDKCSACHQAPKIAALGQVSQMGLECNTCHKEQDPHKGALGANCTKCHSMDGWKGEHLRFTHDAMTRFGLDQDHRRVSCTQCHESGHWKTKGTTCAACHPKFYDKGKP